MAGRTTPQIVAALRELAPVAIPRPVWSAVAEAYGGAGRHYHNLAHVAEVADRYAEVDADLGWQRPVEVFCAVLFHDAVYRPGAADNEAASARLAREVIDRDWPDHGVELDRVAELIELTARHGHLAAADVDAETARFLDCDMAILGAPLAGFAAYCDGVRREYSPVVAADAYAAGRRAFLESLRAAPRIFLSDYFHGRLDGAARRNLDAALDNGDDDLRRGARQFDAGDYFAAHETWEDRWRLTDLSADRHLLQGLIQCAAAMLHADGERGPQALLERARGHFSAVGRDPYRGVALAALVDAVEARVAGGSEPVTLGL